MITTRNRCDDLRRTLGKLRDLHPQPDEILICADGCTDASEEMVESGFPECVLVKNDPARGSVFSRDRMLRLASNNIVVSLDDDSYPLDTGFTLQVKQLFALHPSVAVFTFPEIRDVGLSCDPTKSVSAPPHLVSAYPNCAAAMRRDVYLRSSGFPVFFGHMYEEPDYALQCYSLGLEVRFEPSLRIRHHVSPVQREPMRRHHSNARNELWSVLMRCPCPQIILVSLFRIWRQFRYACSEGLAWAMREPFWWWSAIKGFPLCWQHRRPVPWEIYYRWMKLARQPSANIQPTQRLASAIPK